MTAPEPGRRRRPRGAGPRRGLYLLPSLFTTGNLFFGFFAIIQATTGNPDRAAMGIVLAGVCDALDGRLARLARTTSRFGFEYDTIADTVSFGVAPAMLAFSAGNLAVLGRVGWVMAFLYTACAALRLARFNVSQPRYAGRFEGLPSPAAAGMIAATQWFVSLIREGGAPSFSVAEPVVGDSQADTSGAEEPPVANEEGGATGVKSNKGNPNSDVTRLHDNPERTQHDNPERAPNDISDQSDQEEKDWEILF